MSIKKIALLCFLLLCVNKAISQNLEKKNIIIDGQIDDWNNKIKYYDIQSKINYDFKYDSSNLYLLFSIKGINNIIKVFYKGLSIKIKKSISPKLNSTINYEFYSDFDLVRFNEIDIERNLILYSINHIPPTSKGFIKSKGFINHNNENNFIQYKIKPSGKLGLIYEMAIPFKDLAIENKKKEVALKISLVINGDKLEIRKEEDKKSDEEKEFEKRHKKYNLSESLILRKQIKIK